MEQLHYSSTMAGFCRTALLKTTHTRGGKPRWRWMRCGRWWSVLLMVDACSHPAADTLTLHVATYRNAHHHVSVRLFDVIFVLLTLLLLLLLLQLSLWGKWRCWMFVSIVFNFCCCCCYISILQKMPQSFLAAGDDDVEAKALLWSSLTDVI